MHSINRKHSSKSIVDSLQNEAKRRGYEIFEPQINSMPWIPYELCYELSGYVPNYSVEEDYGNQYPHDIYNIVNEIISAIYGKPDIVHTPDMDDTQDKYWGSSYQIWHISEFDIKNYLFGHPRDGFFHTYLYINNRL